MYLLNSSSEPWIFKSRVWMFTGKRPLSSHNYDRLKQNKRRLIEEIRWSDILFKSLKDMGVFASADYTCMESKLSSFEKKAVLIDALMRRSEEDFEMFQQALVQQGQENIAQILSRGVFTNDHLILVLWSECIIGLTLEPILSRVCNGT